MTDIRWQDVLGPLAGAVAPTLGGMIAGPAGAVVGGALGKALATALGVPDTPEAVRDAIQADPARAQDIMRQIEALQVEQERIAAADRADAREQTVTLVQAGSPIAWGAPAISIVVTLGFLALAGALLVKPIQESQAFLLVVGAMIAAFTQVVAYWLGSSIGSRSKDATIRELSADVPPARGRFDHLKPPVGTLK